MNTHICPLCENMDVQLKFKDVKVFNNNRVIIYTKKIYLCNNCHIMFSSLPKGIGTRKYYRDTSKEHSLTYEKINPPKRLLTIRNIVLRLLKEKSFSIIDIGCGSGDHLNLYSDRVEKYCIEPSETIHPILEKRGIKILGDFIDNVHSRKQFDVITCLNVIEHVKNPDEFLYSIDSILKSGGLLIISTGDINSLTAKIAGSRWAYFSYPEHCCFFSRKAIEDYLVDKYNYRLLEYRRISNREINIKNTLYFLFGLFVELGKKIFPPLIRLINKYRIAPKNVPTFNNNMVLVFKKLK